MPTMTGNGSGGSRVAGETGFSDPGDDDYEAAARKVDAIYREAGRSAFTNIVPSPMETWLGTNSLRPGLDLMAPSQMGDLRVQLVDLPKIGRFN